jgi:type II secretory pathway pseudopilin PulG
MIKRSQKSFDQNRVTPLCNDRPRRSEAGDTLIEVLLAVVILGITSVALLLCFATSISGSAEHRSQVTFDTVLRTASEEALSQFQQQTSSEFDTCTNPTYTVNFSLPTGYSAVISNVQYWNGSSFDSTCATNVPQLITITVTSPTGVTYSISSVVDGPVSPAIPCATTSAACAATQLVFLVTPTAATSTAGQNFGNQPQVAIEDSKGEYVTNDLSYLSLTLNAVSPTTGGTMSGCSGSELGGVVSFSGCSTTQSGTYTLTANDGSLTQTSSPFQVGASLPTQLGFNPVSPGPGTAGGSIPNVAVQVEDSFGNVVTNSNGSISVSLMSGAPQSSFSSGTTTVGVVNGVATFSDLVLDTSGSYTLSATPLGVNGVTSPTNSGSFTVGSSSASSFTVSNPGSQKAGTSFGVTLTAYDAYGNLDSGLSGPQAVNFSGPLTSPNGTSPTYPTSVTFSAGVGTASAIILTDVQSTTLTVTQGSATGSSTPFSVTVGTAATVAISPSPFAATTNGTTNVTLGFQLQDQFGNNTTSTGTTRLTLSTPSSTDFFATSLGASGSLGGTGTVTFNNGAGTGTAYYGDEKAETETVSAVSGTTWGVASVIVTAGTPTQIAFNPVSPGPGTAGSSIPNVAVQAEDRFGNIATTANGSVTVSIASGPRSTFNSGTTNVSVINGVATYSNLVLNTSGSFTLSAAPVGITGVSGTTVSSSFTVSAAGKNYVTITNPGTQRAGTPFSVVMTAYDVYGNVATGFAGAQSVTFSGPVSSPNGTSPTYPASVTFNAGVGTASGIILTDAQTMSLTVSQSGASFGSTSFMVTAGTATKVAISQSPPTTTASGTANVMLGLQLQDQFGNNTTSTGTTTFTLSSPSGFDFFAASLGASGTVGNTGSVSISNGAGTATAYFGDEKAETTTISAINGTTWGTASETVTAGTATKVAISQSPLNDVAGVSSFAGCSINKSGTGYTLTASDGTLATASSTAITVSVGPATQLAFTTSPGASTSGTLFSAQPVVAVEDAGGNTVTSSSSSITLSVNSGTGTLTCTALTKNASSGVDGFAGCKITLGTQGSFSLTASGAGFTATSNSFTVAGTATKVAFATSPGASTGAAVFGTQPVVWVEDSSGDLVTTNTASVALSINSGSGTLACTATPAVAGVATFSGCKITLGAQGTFSLKATATGLSVGTSSSFTVAGAATKLAFTTQPVGPASGTAFSAQPVVSIEDSAGDVVTTNTSPITLSIGTNAGGGSLSCISANPLAVTNGMATFSGCAISASGTGYTLRAAGAGFTVTSSAFNLS